MFKLHILINGVFFRTICLEKAVSLLENKYRCILDVRYTEILLGDGRLFL